MKDKIPVLTEGTDSLPLAPSTEEPSPEIIKERKDPFKPFISEVCIMPDITGNGKTDMQTLAELIAAHFSDSDFSRREYVSVEAGHRFQLL